MLARVSNIEAFRQWRNDEDQSAEDLVRWITTDNPTKQMEAGTAFHKALEDSTIGTFERLDSMGYAFLFCEGASIYLPVLRELRAYAKFGPLTVTGQADCVDGLMVYDHKTTARFDAERYLSGCQWKFYLELFGADVFQWNVFEIREVGDKVYTVQPPQVLRAYRYPGMRADCARLAGEFYEFASAHMPVAA